MIEDNLQKKVNKAGFEKLEDFVKANLHYLSKEKQRLFYGVIGLNKELYDTKVPRKTNYVNNY